MRRVLVSTLVLATLALPAAAQERSLNFALRGGVGAAPSYPGASDYDAVPDVGLTFGALRWGGVNIGNGVYAAPEEGIAVRGALNFIGERDVSDYPELTGLSDVDSTVELGLGVVYRQTNWQAFGEVRRGFGGHEGVVGTLGADVIFRPDSRWTVLAGPRVNFGDSEYANTYFGVTPGEAAVSQFGAFDADGGALGAGVAVEAIYQINDDWALNGLVGYEKLINDAGDSPITMQGDDDQWRVRIGLSRAFTLRF